MADIRQTQFEKDILHLSELDDPLAVFVQHFQYLQSITTDSNILTGLLEQATQTFVDDQRYKNDPRYLKLWLAYARRCREPEDIYAFLAMRGIASALSNYYEDYAGWLEEKGDLEKAAQILKAGIDRCAQPYERLCRNYQEFGKKYSENLNVKRLKVNGERAKEKSGYRLDLIKDGLLTFEEVRAKGWRKAGSILKASYVPPTSTSIANIDNIEDLDDLDLGLGPVDPDELTHISVYRDNTADLKELAKMLPTTKENHRTSDQNNNQSTNGKKSAIDELEFLNEELYMARKGARLSLIQEESDVATSVSGLIPNLLKSSLPSTRLTLNSYHDQRTKVNISCDENNEPILPRIKSLEKSIGRDGKGHNNTVAALKSGKNQHFFVEKHFSNRSFVVVDLKAAISDSTSSQCVLKVTSDGWEPFILTKATGIIGIPQIKNICRHPDSFIFTMELYPYGSLDLLSIKVEERLLLFWIREIIRTINGLHRRRIIHGGLNSKHILIRSGSTPITKESYDPNGENGWCDRGIALIGFTNSLFECESLDVDLASKYRALLGDECPTKVCAIDLYSLLILVKNFKCSRQYSVWKKIVNIIEETLAFPSWSTVEAAYGTILSAIDGVLVGDSVQSPTLKSLLTQLETTLLIS